MLFRSEVKALFLEPGVKLDDSAVEDVAAAIHRCADWHVTPTVRVTRTTPVGLWRRLQKAMVTQVAAARI